MTEQPDDKAAEAAAGTSASDHPLSAETLEAEARRDHAARGVSPGEKADPTHLPASESDRAAARAPGTDEQAVARDLLSLPPD